MSKLQKEVEAHYSREDLTIKILSTLCKAGIDPDNLTRDDIAPFEEFHIGGREETRNLARFANLQPGLKVLDIGCGIGGPARTLVDEFDCQVTGLDLTEEYIKVAKMLSERVGLADKLTFTHGSALEMPYDDSVFDLVWMQHVTMNIENKRALFDEIQRVLKPEGRLVFHEIMAGDGSELHYPVFWASQSSLSHLSVPDEIQALLSESGYAQLGWNEVTQTATNWFQNMINKIKQNGPPSLGLGTLVGTDAPIKAGNVLKNLKEKRLRVIQAIFSCPGS